MMQMQSPDKTSKAGGTQGARSNRRKKSNKLEGNEKDSREGKILLVEPLGAPLTKRASSRRAKSSAGMTSRRVPLSSVLSDPGDSLLRTTKMSMGPPNIDPTSSPTLNKLRAAQAMADERRSSGRNRGRSSSIDQGITSGTGRGRAGSTGQQKPPLSPEPIETPVRAHETVLEVEYFDDMEEADGTCTLILNVSLTLTLSLI